MYYIKTKYKILQKYLYIISNFSIMNLIISKNVRLLKVCDIHSFKRSFIQELINYSSLKQSFCKKKHEKSK